MPQRIPTTLFQELVGRKIISAAQAALIEDEIKKSGGDLGRYLISKNIISDVDLANLKSEIYRLPVIRVSEIEVNREVIKEIAEDVVTFYQVVAFAHEGSVLKVGITNPEDVEALEALKFVGSNKRVTLEKYIISYGDFDGL